MAMFPEPRRRPDDIELGTAVVHTALGQVRRDLSYMQSGSSTTFVVSRSHTGKVLVQRDTIALDFSKSNRLLLDRREADCPIPPNVRWLDSLRGRVRGAVGTLQIGDRFELKLNRTTRERFDWTCDHVDVGSGHVLLPENIILWSANAPGPSGAPTLGA